MRQGCLKDGPMQEFFSMLRIAIFIFLSSLFFSPWAYGDFEFYRGVRQMGMGGASIAVVNDETAVLSNPNGLARLRNYFFTLLDPEVSGNNKMGNSALRVLGDRSVSPQGVYDQLEKYRNTPYYFKAQMFPSIVLPHFGMGVLGRHEVLARRRTDNTYDYNYQNDYSFNLGYNMSFWGGRLKFGFAGRLINRLEFFGTRDPSTDSLSLDSMARQGLGAALDTGITLSAPWEWIPTLTFYGRDLGDTSFSLGEGFFTNNVEGRPERVKQSIDMAVALFPIFSHHSRGTFTIEYRGIDDTEGVDDPMDRLHIGTEVNLWDAYFLRAGYYENDWTLGYEYSTGVFQLQMATYSERVELGSFQDRDRRGIFKISFRL